MSRWANDTLPLDGPAVRGAASDTTSDMLRIVRRAVRRADSNSALSRAIRSAVGACGAGANGEYAVADRIATLLAPWCAAPPGRAAHLETVR